MTGLSGLLTQILSLPAAIRAGNLSPAHSAIVTQARLLHSAVLGNVGPATPPDVDVHPPVTPVPAPSVAGSHGGPAGAAEPAATQPASPGPTPAESLLLGPRPRSSPLTPQRSAPPRRTDDRSRSPIGAAADAAAAVAAPDVSAGDDADDASGDARGMPSPSGDPVPQGPPVADPPSQSDAPAGPADPIVADSVSTAPASPEQRTITSYMRGAGSAGSS